jgi:hypothetical protein
MYQEQQNQQPGNSFEPYSFSDEPTRKKIRKHLRDINDVITEKDIKNVKVPGKEKPVTVRPEKKAKKVTKLAVHDAPGKPITPWDILDEE